MSLKRYNSLSVAEEILKRLDTDERLKCFEGSEDVIVGTYRMNREHGYVVNIWSNDKSRYVGIFFSEHKSSDDIAVRYGVNEGSFISDEDFDSNSRYFRCYSFSEVVDYIINLIFEIYDGDLNDITE